MDPHVKKKDEKAKMEEMHQRKVEKMIKSAEGSAGLLHKITKPTMWRGGVQILKKEEEEEVARLSDRCEAKRKEWAKHWKCDESVQNAEDRPWKNEELEKLEEASPRLKECDLEKVSELYKAKTGVGCDGFHQKIPLDLTKETRGKVVELIEKVEQRMFFLIPKNVTSEIPFCAHANADSLVGSLESARSGQVTADVSRGVGRYRQAKWRSSAYSVGNIDGNGGVQRTVWEILMEMEELSVQCGKY